ncbi:MAG: hypothetical protein A3B90_00285 [Candidatus Magasanikbacteria bacterium RIFCSPHIGHO2_02_FULL_41_13]|uniref:Uncharacterized protein n=1 Tax=Candidatus Magasanikbacteria bacterium RIFCSPHIGHO2_02_FULL_41_13 TaxID=1798676 RepID=A0A1F6M4F5_9BACT|nr:MAG: hypothetical protein A3B90_00285 [Candidatus Magasanikbacteria bacterium RIFCSPHIGHO2_02_FULL_41_13]
MALTAAAVEASVGCVLVDRAVAVVVLPVTVLGEGQQLTLADVPALEAETGLRAIAAGTDAAGGRGARVASLLQEAIVGLSVAVVVEAIAFFSYGEYLLFAGLVSRTVGVAMARSAVAGPDLVGFGRSIVAGTDCVRIAGAAHAVVDLAIAVVVGTVDAVLGAWDDFPQTLGHLTVDALLHATAAGPDALAKGRAIVAAYPEAGAAVVVLIDLAIAVVVEVVTKFVAGLESQGRADRLPRHSIAHHDPFGAAFTESGRAGLAESRQVVDLSVAVVVEVVAGFGGRRKRRGRAAKLPSQTTALQDSLGAAFTDADRAGFADSVEVVGGAVAVVVQSVAELGAGQILVKACSPVVVWVTKLGASMADALVEGVCGPGVAVLGAPRLTITLESVVNLSVTVVVGSVTELVLGDAGDACATVTGRQSLAGADALANCAGLVEVEAVVDDVVAVVVQPVAEFGAGVAVVGVWRQNRRVDWWGDCSISRRNRSVRSASAHVGRGGRSIERQDCRVGRRRNRSIRSASAQVGRGQSVERSGRTIACRIVRARVGVVVVCIGGASAVRLPVGRIHGIRASVLTRSDAIRGGHLTIGRVCILVYDADPGHAHLAAFAV